MYCIKFGKPLFFKKYFPPFSLFPSESPMCMLVHLMVFHRSLRLFTFHLFLFVPQLIISSVLSFKFTDSLFYLLNSIFEPLYCIFHLLLYFSALEYFGKGSFYNFYLCTDILILFIHIFPVFMLVFH